MTLYDAKDVTVMIGGRALDAQAFEVEMGKALAETHDAVSRAASSVYEMTAAVTISGESFARFQNALFARNGASDATLFRRASYGGRKGRRAMRRLMVRGWSYDAALLFAAVHRVARLSGRSGR